MKKPNVLFILTDQQRADTMRCYGNDRIQVPNLNALAEDSFVFDRAYVTQPVCSPSRASLLAGLYPHSSGVPACNIPLSPDIATLAELASEEYLCAYFGKWHLGDEIFPQHGFTEWVGTEDSYRRFFSKPENLSHVSEYNRFLVENGFSPDSQSLGQRVFSRHAAASMEEPFTKPAFLADQAAKFINRNTHRPFVLFVSYLEPHPPHTGPLNDLYDPLDLPTGPNFMTPPPANASLLNRVLAAYYTQSEEYGYDLRSEEGWRRVRARYWGNITLVDRSIGKILQALETAGRADNTIVVFTSDHGEMVGDHGILGKTVLYEEAVRVPLLMRIPGIGPSPRRILGNFSQIDLVPSLLELMGERTPDHLQGTSRTPVLHGKSTLERNNIFIEWNGSDGHPRPGEAEVNPAMGTPWRTVVSADRWKLNLSAHDQCELYDLDNDPFEQVNLFDAPEHLPRVKDMAATLRLWQEETDDRTLLPDL